MRFRRALSAVRNEIRTVRSASRASGARDALIARARHDLGLDEFQVARIESVESRLAALESSSGQMPMLQHQVDRLEEFAAQSRATEEVFRRTDAERLQALEALAGAVTSIDAHSVAVDGERERLALHERIGPVTAWIESAHVSEEIGITVVVATRDRRDQLRRALESVRTQEYGNWQLIVVDDGSSDGTPEFLDQIASEDSRVTALRQLPEGVGAARNKGLAAATGDVVCYLDDDNLMGSLWLKSVAWAFDRDPELELLYGARITDVERGQGSSSADLPFLHFEPFDRALLALGNFIDLGVIAHRRSLPEAKFDESLQALGDWDLLLRLTEERAPLALPVVASYYSTSAPNRISLSGKFAVSESAIRLRMARQGPLRVLAYTSLYPLVPETYIPDEMKALTDNGALLAWCTDRWSPSPVRLAEPMYKDLDEAVREFEPDVLLVYWAAFAVSRLEALSRVGKPFGLRVHSFDFSLEDIEQVRAHPLCIGIWAYPHHAEIIGDCLELVPLLTTGSAFPEPASERTIVLAACACLPKKDWPTLVKAFAELSEKGVDCRIVAGVTAEFEDEPKVIRQLIYESGEQVMLSVDVPHDQMIQLLARTAVVVYTSRFDVPFGMPRSIVEGMFAGTSVILPDRPEARCVAGPDCRTYVNAEDIVGHALEILAGGPEIETERAFNRTFAERHFADPALAERFTAEVVRSLIELRARRP